MSLEGHLLGGMPSANLAAQHLRPFLQTKGHTPNHTNLTAALSRVKHFADSPSDPLARGRE